MTETEQAGWTQRRPYLAFGLFWLLAYAISWSAFVVGSHLPSNGPRSDSFIALATRPVSLVVKFGPTLAGLILLAVGGGAVRGRFLTAARSVSPALLLLALAVPGVLTAAGLAATGAAAHLDPGFLVAGFSLAGLAYWIALRTLMGGGLGEEPGLRGVALPLLLTRMGPRRAAVLLGLFWGLWHLPVLLGRPPLNWIGQFALTISISLIVTFVWVKVRPSLSAAILFHGAINGWTQFANVGWSQRLPALHNWQTVQLGGLLLISLLLLPLRWRRNEPHQELTP